MGFLDKARGSSSSSGQTPAPPSSTQSTTPSSSNVSSASSTSTYVSSPSQKPAVPTSSRPSISTADQRPEQSQTPDQTVDNSQNLPAKEGKAKIKVSSHAKAQHVLTEEELAVKDRLKEMPEGESYETIFDKIFDSLSEKDYVPFTQIANTLSVSLLEAETLLRILESMHLVELVYPLVGGGQKVRKLKTPEMPKKVELAAEKKLLESYVVFADFIFANVKIWSIPEENTPIYELILHDVKPATEAFIYHVIDVLATEVDVKFVDITDPRKSQAQKIEFLELSRKKVAELVPSMSKEMTYVMAGSITHIALGLGNLDILLADNWLEEIAINGSSEPLSVYHRRFGWLKSSIYYSTESQVYNLASQIGRKVGKQITALDPIMDAQMQTGDRVAATLFPISTEGDTLTIRRFSRNPWTVIHMIDEKNNTMSKELMAFLWMAMQFELNIIVAGGTASGKTSVLNTLSSLIPSTNRIISIEDTREISLPEALHWNWVPLTSKSANSEGEGAVTMLDLMVASLRMRPDRIVVGEIRRKQQAEALFEAMHTGHAVSATMHADTAEQLRHRLTQPPIDIPENELQALQLVVIQYRDRRRGVRRTLEVAELLPGTEDEKIQLNYLYRWRPRTDTFVADESSVRVIEDLNLHTGMTRADIESDMAEKQEILSWMLKNKLYDIDRVGQVMRIYYKYPELLLDTIHDEGTVEDALKHDTSDLS